MSRAGDAVRVFGTFHSVYLERRREISGADKASLLSAFSWTFSEPRTVIRRKKVTCQMFGSGIVTLVSTIWIVTVNRAWKKDFGMLGMLYGARFWSHDN